MTRYSWGGDSNCSERTPTHTPSFIAGFFDSGFSCLGNATHNFQDFRSDVFDTSLKEPLRRPCGRLLQVASHKQ